MKELAVIEWELLEVLTDAERATLLQRFWEIIPHGPALLEEGQDTLPSLWSITQISFDLDDAGVTALWGLLIETYWQSNSASFWAYLPSCIAEDSLRSIRSQGLPILPSMLAAVLPRTLGALPKMAMTETVLLIKGKSQSAKEHEYANSLKEYILPFLNDPENMVCAYAKQVVLKFSWD